jgi:dTDP-glucose pyrophosphorylase
MTDFIKDVKKSGGKVGVYPISEKSWVDIGQWEEYREAIKRLSIEQ